MTLHSLYCAVKKLLTVSPGSDLPPFRRYGELKAENMASFPTCDHSTLTRCQFICCCWTYHPEQFCLNICVILKQTILGVS